MNIPKAWNAKLGAGSFFCCLKSYIGSVPLLFGNYLVNLISGIFFAIWPLCKWSAQENECTLEHQCGSKYSENLQSRLVTRPNFGAPTIFESETELIKQ